MSETTQIVKVKRKMNRDTKQSIIVLIAFAVMMAFFGIKSEYFLKPFPKAPEQRKAPPGRPPLRPQPI